MWIVIFFLVGHITMAIKTCFSPFIFTVKYQNTCIIINYLFKHWVKLKKFVFHINFGWNDPKCNFPEGTNVIHSWWTNIYFTFCKCMYFATTKSLIFKCNPLQRSILDSIYWQCVEYLPYIISNKLLYMYSFENFT